MTAPGGAAQTRRPDEAPGLIDWSLAERVGVRLASRRAPVLGYRAEELARDFVELTARAEDLVEEATGLRSPAGPARARVTERTAWVRANVASIQRLLAPTLLKVEHRRQAQKEAGGTRTALRTTPRPLASLGRAASGAQLGMLLAWMSTRVLGQYDLLLTEDGDQDQDVVYFVGSNVVALEARYGFPPRQFRLWLALHEVTHRCQFTAVPWLRDHFLSLVDQGLEPVAADPRRLLEAVRRTVEDLRAHRNPWDDAGIAGLVATPEQLESLRRLQAMMSLLEGHGDVTMDRAGSIEVPGADRFARVLRERRQQARGPARLLQQVLGLEAKLRQYAEGERFVNEVESAGGPELLSSVWRGPEWLPSLAEIKNPAEWVARVRQGPAFA